MKLSKIISSASVALMLSAFGISAAEITLKAGHINQPNSPVGLAFEKFAEIVSEKSKGEIEIEVFPASQLGSIDAMFDNLEAGSLDMMIELLEWYGRWDKRFGVFGLPYLFEDRNHLKSFLDTQYFKKDMVGVLEEKLDATFFVDRIEWDMNLDRTLLCKKPIFVPADLEGQKLRMFQSRIPVLSWETLGASVQILPWAETYTALATGTVDAITARVEAHYNMRQTEVAKYITITKEYFQAYVPIMSNKTKAKLTDAQVALIEESAYEAGEWFSNYTGSVQAEFEELVRVEDGVSIIEPPLAPWQEKMSSAYATFEAEGEIPSGMIDRVLAAK